ncbi:MAG TPA: thioesterase family protein [Rhodopila sp.]|uniref:thioesterase family protein n=1 Tax=Rhodopila sp. TaxID=2480087 RepID=UPI002BED216D|nr:thioesterase family protein [Rhodopila sp.]HVY17319.1 thioesterase family protein [Rhodopila sp.]
MTAWIETYRGAVPPWQCDVTEHFTVAYYFDRLEEAQANLVEALNLPATPRRGRIDARFTRELREGASFHVESAPLLTGTGLRLGHRFVDSANGEPVTWFDGYWDTGSVDVGFAEWNGPETERRVDPVSRQGYRPTARGRVKPNDLDAAGYFSLSAMVHRFSASSAQAGTAIGMTAAVAQQERRGFSTFELILHLSGSLEVDAPYLVETGIAHLGNSSLRMIHRMTDPRTGDEIARLSQYGVNLDLDARRPARWPDTVRDAAQALVIPG